MGFCNDCKMVSRSWKGLCNDCNTISRSWKGLCNDCNTISRSWKGFATIAKRFPGAGKAAQRLQNGFQELERPRNDCKTAPRPLFGTHAKGCPRRYPFSDKTERNAAFGYFFFLIYG